jgi:hypothetical protein
MDLALNSFQLFQRDTIIVGGDTLFFEDFSLNTVTRKLESFRQTFPPSSSIVLAYDTDDAGASKYGILEVDQSDKVLAFLEKPGPQSTSSRLACPCFYILSPDAVKLVATFLDDHKDSPMQAKDAPGNFVRYLQNKVILPPFPTLLLIFLFNVTGFTNIYFSFQSALPRFLGVSMLVGWHRTLSAIGTSQAIKLEFSPKATSEAFWVGCFVVIRPQSPLRFPLAPIDRNFFQSS